MPAPAIIPQDASLVKGLEHIVHSRTKVSAHALTQALCPAWDAIQDDWFKVNQKEILLWIAILTAAAKIVAVDDQLDILANSISSILLGLHNNDRDSPDYIFYFKNYRLSDLKKPVLGKQLGVMREWADPLKKSGNASLQELAEQLEKLVTAADTAVAELTAANQANREFRLVGERKQFIDKLNELRQSSYGEIAKLPHKHPELGLPNTFADRFFKTVSRPSEDPIEAMTSEQLVGLIADKETEVGGLRDRLKEVLAAEAAEAKNVADRSAAEETLAKMREDAAKLQAQMAELEKTLKK